MMEDYDPASLDDFFSKPACAPTSAGTRSKAATAGTNASDAADHPAVGVDVGIYQHPAHRVIAQDKKVHVNGPPKRVIMACAVSLVILLMWCASDGSSESSATQGSDRVASRSNNERTRYDSPIDRRSDIASKPAFLQPARSVLQDPLLTAMPSPLPQAEIFESSHGPPVITTEAFGNHSEDNGSLPAAQANTSEIGARTSPIVASSTEGDDGQIQGQFAADHPSGLSTALPPAPAEAVSAASSTTTAAPAAPSATAARATPAPAVATPTLTLAPLLPTAPASPLPVSSTAPTLLSPDEEILPGFVALSGTSLLSYSMSTRSWGQAEIVGVAISSKEHDPGCLLIQYENSAKGRVVVRPTDFAKLLRPLPQAPTRALATQQPTHAALNLGASNSVAAKTIEAVEPSAPVGS